MNVNNEHENFKGLDVSSNKEMYDFWLDRPVPFCCRDCVPKRFQHEGQLYEFSMYKKVSKAFKGKCPKYKEVK